MFNVRLAGGHLYGKQLFTWLSLVVSLMASFVLSFFPLDVLDEIWDLIESVSEGFLTYSYVNVIVRLGHHHSATVLEVLTLLHSEWPKLHRVLAVLSAIALSKATEKVISLLILLHPNISMKKGQCYKMG